MEREQSPADLAKAILSQIRASLTCVLKMLASRLRAPDETDITIVLSEDVHYVLSYYAKINHPGEFTDLFMKKKLMGYRVIISRDIEKFEILIDPDLFSLPTTRDHQAGDENEDV